MTKWANFPKVGPYEMTVKKQQHYGVQKCLSACKKEQRVSKVKVDTAALWCTQVPDKVAPL